MATPNKVSKPTFANQSALPRLPIPSLPATLSKYRYTLQALLTPSQLDATDRAIADSAHILHSLQHRLLAHDKAQSHSWLELWWYKYVYLGWRVPLLVNSNWWLLLQDEHLPYMDRNQPPLCNNTFTDHQIKRAAGLISNLINVKLLLDTEQYPADVSKAGPLCMNQYRHVFGVTRVPHPQFDTIRTSFPCTATHITVLAKDQCFKVPTLDKDGHRLSLRRLEHLLLDIVKTVQVSDFKPSVPIPILTAENRDTWADARSYLIDMSATNAESIETIESSLFAVCLDDWACASDSMDQSIRVIAHGMNAHNRWFDKSINVVVSANARAGCNGEHSPQDALIPAILFEHVVGNEPARDPPGCSATSAVDPVVHLQFVSDKRVDQYLGNAEFNNHRTIMDTDIAALVFKEYGTDFMKKVAAVSPDSYVQLAMQLAYRNLHPVPASTYETASTRQYLHGRTEVCRTLLPEVKQWTDLMMTPANKQAKVDAFHKAARAHSTYISEASKGFGVDRHLLGLKLVLKEGEVCPMFQDPAFAQSQNWQLSTSGLSPKSYQYLYCTGFGSVVPNGYGINYFSGTNQIHFGIESKRSCAETSTDLFRSSLVAALHEIRSLFVGHGSEKAKL